MKEKILKATLELAYEQGLGQTSMSQIAERAGIKKSSLYSHYRSRMEIIEKMYAYFREEAKKQQESRQVDYDKLVIGRSLEQILTAAVGAYQALINDPQMKKFYKVIMAERSLNPDAAQILVTETRKMIHACEQLFYAVQTQGAAHFANLEAAAFSFAMSVHAIIEYEEDADMIGSQETDGMMQQYIAEFCRTYGMEK